MADKKEIRWGLIGYGGAFGMGKAHGSWINACQGMRTVAVCDADPERAKTAEQELPGVTTYTNYKELLKNPDVDCVVNILPHNLHYSVTMDCLAAGKGVVLEKPMCITTEEATEMIELAKKQGVLLTVFHNRRHDGDYMAVKEIIDKGVIGEIYRIEAFMGGWGHPGTWWRSSKEISGGNFYDWGAHLVDWVLNFMSGKKIANVTGFFFKKVWMDVTNEDETQGIIRFKDGAYADVTVSSIARAGKPRWRILGTKGAIIDHWDGKFKVYVEHEGYPAEMEIKYKPSTWEEWYPNLAAHLLEGKELEVKPEEARRVIMVIDYAERSAKAGVSMETPFE